MLLNNLAIIYQFILYNDYARFLLTIPLKEHLPRPRHHETSHFIKQIHYCNRCRADACGFLQ